MKIEIEISKEVNDELHKNHFSYGVLNVTDGIVFLSCKEQLYRKLHNE